MEKLGAIEVTDTDLDRLQRLADAATEAYGRRYFADELLTVLPALIAEVLKRRRELVDLALENAELRAENAELRKELELKEQAAIERSDWERS